MSGQGLYVVVTPGNQLACRFQPDTSPPVVKDEAIRFRVTVDGVRGGKVRWRLPIYSGSNGANDIAVARIGDGKPGEDHSFTIDLNIADLQRSGDSQDLELEVSTEQGRKTVCKTGGDPVRMALRNLSAPELTTVNGAVTR